jgi:tetratricopeptide (TPR) repeat protein
MNTKTLLIITILIHAFWLQPTYASTPQQLFEEGSRLANQNEHQDAIKLFKKALEYKIDSNYHKAVLFYNIGLSYSKLGDTKKSISSYTTCLQYYPNYTLAYLNRGNDNFNEGKVEEAINDFSDAIALDSKLFFAYNSRAIAYIKLNEFEKSILDLNYAIQLNPKYLNAYKNRARVYSQTNKFQLALLDIEKAISLDTKDAWFYNLAAWIYATYPDASVRNASRAVTLAQKAVKLSEDSRSLDTLAAAYAEQGSFDLALRTQKLAIEMLPDDSNKELRIRLKNRYKKYKNGKPWRDKELLN